MKMFKIDRNFFLYIHVMKKQNLSIWHQFFVGKSLLIQEETAKWGQG